MSKSSNSIKWGSAVKGTEGNAIALAPITGNWTKLTISEIPVGAVLVDGAGHTFTATAGKTTVNVTGWALDSLVITPVSDINFKLIATTGGGVSATESVVVDPLAPTVTWAPAPAAAPGGSAIALGAITVQVNKLAADGSDNKLQSVVVDSIPVGATLSDGHGHSFTAVTGATSVNVSKWALSHLSITAVGSENFTLQVTATERDAQGNTSSATASEQVIVNTPTDHAPTITAGAPSTAVVEAGVATDGTPILGTDVSVVHLAKGDLETAANYDTTGWTANGNGTFIKVGAYGTATLDLNVDALTYTLNNSSHATNALVAGQAVSDKFTIKVTETGGPLTGSVDVSFAVIGTNDAAVITGTSTASLTESNAVLTASGDLNATDVDGSAAFVAQTDVAGSNGYGTFSIDATGAWTYTTGPSAHNEFVGGTTYNDSITVATADGTTQVVTVNILGTNDAAVVTGTSTAALIETNAAQSTGGTLVATDPDSSNAFVAQTDVAGSNGYGHFSIDVGGVWTYTMDSAHNEFVGGTDYTDSITVATADGTTKVVTVNILGTNDAAILSADVANLTETDLAADISTSGTLTIADVDSPTEFVAQAGTAGSYGTFAINAAGAWTYAADAAHNEFAAGETYTDTFAVTSGDGTATSVTINILGTNDAAILSADVANLTETDLAADISTSGTLTIADVDSPTEFVAQAGTAGSYGTFAINAAGAWTYAAGATHNEFAAGETYTDTFAVTSGDGTATSVTINILGTNDAAILSADVANLTETDLAADISTSGTLTIADVDSPTEFVAQAGTAGSYGTFAIDAAGAWTYAADAAHNEFAAGETYTDSFAVTSGDGTLTSVTINIAGTNDSPVFTSADTSIEMTGLLAASDAESDPLTYGLADGQGAVGTYGSLSVGSDGAWTYAPDAPALGGVPNGTIVPDSFVVQVDDGRGGLATQVLTIDVTGSAVGGNVAPIFTSTEVQASLADTAAADHFGPLTGSLSASDGNGDLLTFSAIGGDPVAGNYGALSVLAVGNWTYVPDSLAIDSLLATDIVSDVFTIQVDDGNGGIATQSLTVNVTGANDAPVLQMGQNVVVVENSTVVTDLLAYDPEWTDPVSFSIAGGADAAQFDIVNGQLVFKTAPNYATDPHSFTVDVAASDGSATTTQTMTIDVVQNNTSMFSVIDPTQASSQASSIIHSIMGSNPGITFDATSLQMVAGSSSAMYYDGSLTQLGIGSGLLITSGTVPNTSNTVGYFGQDNGMVGDPALDAVVSAKFLTTSYDATTITFSFTVTDPTITGISLNAVFGSDEYPEWVDAFVDIGVVLVNGVNVAYFGNDPNAPLSVVGSNLSANYFIDNTGNLDTPSYSGVAVPGVPSTLPIEYDGVSHPLTIYAPVHVGVNTIEFGIADTGDHVYDSGLFISNIQASTAPVSGVVLDVPCTDNADTITGTNASESINAGGGDDVINAGGGNDIVLGGTGNDDLSGGDGSDFIDGGSGNNIVDGGAGDDTIQHTSAGHDHIDGGTGTNTLLLELSDDTAGEHIDLSDTSAVHTLADGTTFVNIEVINFQGGSGADTVVGGAANDILNGGAGNDFLTGAGGNDQINGGDGTDTAVYSGDVSDYTVTNVGIDLYQITDMRAGSPDGADTLNGVENLQFAHSTVLLSGQIVSGATIQGTGNDDTINASQTVSGQPLTTDSGDTIYGNGGDDNILGGNGADHIYGGSGNDFLNGGAGNDFIFGDAGHDELTGGLGADTFVFATLSDSPVIHNDVILDFSQAEGDIIDLSQIDAITGFGGSSFSYVASFTGVAGQLISVLSGDGYSVQGDVTGHGTADFAIQVDTHAALSQSSFLL